MFILSFFITLSLIYLHSSSLCASPKLTCAYQTSDIDEDAWTSYFHITKQGPPRNLLLSALKHTKKTNKALELGSGAGTESVFLLKQGWDTTSVDSDRTAERFLREAAAHIKDQDGRLVSDRINFVKEKFQELDFDSLGTFDLIFIRSHCLLLGPRIFRHFGQNYARVLTRMES